VSLPGGTQLPSWAVVATVAVAVLGIIITVSVVWLQGGDGPLSTASWPDISAAKEQDDCRPKGSEGSR